MAERSFLVRPRRDRGLDLGHWYPASSIVRRARNVKPLPSGRPDVVVSAEGQVLLAVDFGELAGELDRLCPELRAVVQATVIDGLTTKEAGACSVSRLELSKHEFDVTCCGVGSGRVDQGAVPGPSGSQM